MKKIILLGLLALFSTLVHAQSVTVFNNTADPLMVYVASGDDYAVCSGVSTYDTYVGAGLTATIPMLYPDAWRIGCMKMNFNIPDPSTGSCDYCPAWYGACGPCGGTGTYTFTWTGCTYVEIN